MKRDEFPVAKLGLQETDTLSLRPAIRFRRLREISSTSARLARIITAAEWKETPQPSGPRSESPEESLHSSDRGCPRFEKRRDSAQTEIERRSGISRTYPFPPAGFDAMTLPRRHFEKTWAAQHPEMEIS